MMKSALALAAILCYARADPGFVQLSVTKSTSKAATDLSRRSFAAGLENSVTQYEIAFQVGTPGQPQIGLVDTGSSDVWLYANGSSGAPYTYDTSQSSTSKFVNSDLYTSYLDGTLAQGDYYMDEVTVGNVSVNLQVGVADEPFRNYPYFGIASPKSEGDILGPYPNYPIALKQQGIIESTAYALYLNEINSTSGTLLLGGVDTSKYSGQLYTVPITSDEKFNVDFEVNEHKLNGMLDSGTSLTYLPSDIVNGLAQTFGANWSEDLKVFQVASPPANASVTFSFSGAPVTLSSSELFFRYQNSTIFSIVPAEQIGGDVILGDSFLRSAYVVYDLDNSQIAIAQAKYDGSGTVLPITSTGIPGAKPAPELQ